MINDLKKAKDRVQFLLSKYPATRDCDKTLWLAYLVCYHDLKNQLEKDGYESFKKLLLSGDTCTMESIRRIRQKFQEHGFYVGTKRKFKMKEAELVREMMRSE